MQSAGFRYRFFQYFNQMNICVKYRKGLSDFVYNKYMPIAEKGCIIKVLVFLFMLVRVSYFMVCDLFCRPDVIVISRIIVKPKMPLFYCFVLNSVKKRGTKIYWDFDDNILELRELTRKTFDYFSKITDKIILASPYLKDLILEQYHSKILQLPTTDGQLTKLNQKDRKKRLVCDYNHTIRLLWVGTSSGLLFLKSVLDGFEDAAQKLKTFGKELELVVVSNKDIQYKSENFTYTFKKWSIDEANIAFLTSHIGLMPLDESIMARGKGGFKLIQYLSIGLPSIASPVGINADILSHGGGFLAKVSEIDKWSEFVVKLGTDIALWEKCSKEAKHTFDNYYSYENNLRYWTSLIN